MRPDPRSELAVAAALLAAAAAAVAFVVLYAVHPDTQLLGLSLGLSLALLAVAAVLAGKWLVPQEQADEEYADFGDEGERDRVDAIVRRSGEGLSRRRLILGAAGVAGATLGTAAIVPAASLGPRVGDRIQQTPWRRGRRVVDVEDRPIRAADVEEGVVLTGFPEGADKGDIGSPVVIVRVAEGVVAFSKICPHAGCAVSIYRHPLHAPTSSEPALVCPCHFSTFDPRRGGRLVFGPAGRDLPRLPLRTGPDDTLEAAGGFVGQVGPSYGGSRIE